VIGQLKEVAVLPAGVETRNDEDRTEHNQCKGWYFEILGTIVQRQPSRGDCHHDVELMTKERKTIRRKDKAAVAWATRLNLQHGMRKSDGTVR
jgi:hypothetical protein